MVEQLGLDEGACGDYDRAMALIDAILQAAQRLKQDSSDDGFDLLNISIPKGQASCDLCLAA